MAETWKKRKKENGERYSSGRVTPAASILTSKSSVFQIVEKIVFIFKHSRNKTSNIIKLLNIMTMIH